MEYNRKLSKDEVDSIKELHEQGRSSKEISDKLKIKQSKIIIWVAALNHGFDSIGEYRNYLARRRGFNSNSEYNAGLWRRLGFNSVGEYHQYLALDKGFKSVQEYKDFVAMQKGYSTHSEYRTHRRKENMQRSQTKKFKELIKQQLTFFDKNLVWLAERTGINYAQLQHYTSGMHLPRRKNLERIALALRMDKRNLEAILQ